MTININNNNATNNNTNRKNEECSDNIYTSLIQQYLSLMLYDNAIFLSERYVASVSSSSSSSLKLKLHSNYLLATCYYKSKQIKKAMYVLQNLSYNNDNNTTINYSSSSTTMNNNNDENKKLIQSCNYLLSKCYYDLGLYKKAEEVLLYNNNKKNKLLLRRIIQQLLSDDASTQQNEIEEEELNELNNLVPNGAAGYYLLGCICRKTYRNSQGYFILSLKLDPLMFVSYIALCEIGCNNNAVPIDPISIFGVLPSEYSNSVGSVDEDADELDDDYNYIDHVDYNNNHHHDHHPQRDILEESCSKNLEKGCATFLLSSPTNVDVDNMEEKDDDNNNTTRLLSMVDMSYSTPPTANKSSKTPPALSRLRHSSSRFYSPELTPIQHLPIDHDTNTNAGVDTTTNTGGSIRRLGGRTKRSRTSPYIVARARTVVSRLYYEPTPECSSHPSMSTTTHEHEHEHDDSINNNNITSLTTTAPTEDHNNATIAESSTIAFDVSGCGSEIGAFFTNLGTITDTNDYVKKRTGGRYIKSSSEHQHDDAAAAAGGILASIGKPTEEGQQQHPDRLQNNNLINQDKNNNHNEINNNDNNNSSIQEILTILCTIGTGIQHLSQYRCKEAISTFHTLPSHHFHTGYIQNQIGKAYFEISDYNNAKQTLEYMSKLEPYRIQGLDILSTTLWHLKLEIDLCALAQRVVSIDKLSPYTWVVVGNCFSLQKEHESALLFFKRSIQLNPYYTYAYTLSGHEYVSNEDLDNATLSFRNALRIDTRHYYAWYGLGNILYRQEKYNLATYHFQKALSIHSTSSILLCYLATSQYANHQIHEALHTLDIAINNDNATDSSTGIVINPQARFQRATIYMKLHRYHEALIELEYVKNIVPRESSVYFHMGKVYKKLNIVDKAMRCFLIALDLDPKDHNLIKSYMERLNLNGNSDNGGVDFGSACGDDEDDDDDDGYVSTM